MLIYLKGNKMELNTKIDVTYDFTSEDNDKFWEGFDIINNPNGSYDPDRYSLTLRNYHKILWSKSLPDNKTKFELVGVVEDGHYLVDDERLINKKEKYFCDSQNSLMNKESISCVLIDRALENKTYKYDYTRYSSDGMINAFLRMNINFKKELEQIEDEVKDFYRKAYTIGGMIIFPRISSSINASRGIYSKIEDRFDLTLQCIKIYYDQKDNGASPLSYVLSKNNEFFDLFTSFQGYVDFFFLQDFVTADGVIDIMSKDKKILSDFVDNPLPKNLAEWRIWKTNSLEFIDKRNIRIDKWAKDNNY